MKKLLAALLMFTLLFGCALAERHPQDSTPITLHGVRAAFFDVAGNYTPALNVNGLTYVPVAAFSKAAGVNVQLDGSNIVAVKKDKTAGYQFYHLSNTKSPIIPDYFTEVRLDPASPYLLAKHPTRGWCVHDASGSLIN